MERKDYLEELGELRDMLKWLLRKDFLEELVQLSEEIDKSYVGSYNRIKENSRWGKDCGYAAKAKELFMQFNEKSISEKIKHIYEAFIKY